MGALAASARIRAGSFFAEEAFRPADVANASQAAVVSTQASGTGAPRERSRARLAPFPPAMARSTSCSPSQIRYGGDPLPLRAMDLPSPTAHVKARSESPGSQYTREATNTISLMYDAVRTHVLI